MTTLLLILMSTMLVNVFVLAGTPQARGSKDHQGRWGKEVGVAVFGALMLLGAAVGGYAFEYAILKPTHFEYLRTLSLVGLIAALTPAARALVGKIMPNSVIASVRFIEALTSNAASLGVALFSALHAASWGAAIELGVGCALGFAFAVTAFASLRERISNQDVPRAVRGPPLALVSAGLMALALLGLSGLIRV